MVERIGIKCSYSVKNVLIRNIRRIFKEVTFLLNILYMEFGKTEPEQLKSIDLSLPPEPVVNKAVLAKSKKTAPKIYVGCPEWGKKEWVGRFYPPGTQERDFLFAYAHLFNCIELNTTY